MRRVLSATVTALLVAGLLPLPVLAAAPVASPVTVADAVEDTDSIVTLRAESTDGTDVVDFTVGAPANGSLGGVGTIACDTGDPKVCTAEVTYTPDADFNGGDSFTFTATTDVESAPATVTITVGAVNDQPSFVAGTNPAVDEDSGPQVVAAWIADADAGAPDETAQALAYTLVPNDPALFAAGPAVSPAGTLTFTPADDAFGSTSVEISATDDGVPPEQSSTTSFTITIAGVNDAPSFTAGPDIQVARSQASFAAPGWATSISAGPGESDDLAFTVVAADPSLFAVQPAVSPAGELTFSPAGTAGQTTVEVTLGDDGTPTASSASETLTITLTDGPAADAQLVTVDEDSSANPITLTGSDPEDDPLTFAVVDGPSHGTLSGDAPDLTYTPDANWFGADSFTFTVDDGDTVSPEATVSITVTAVNDAPDAKSDAVAVKATVTTVIDLFKANGGGADSAGPGESAADLVITSVSTPAKGTATIVSGGTAVSYDPAGCSTGSDVFTYTVSDGEYTDSASVVVTINRPGQGGNSTSPITDVPAYTFITNSTMGTTVPVRLSWCGVTTSGTSVKSYKVQQSTNAGLSYSSTLYSATTAKSKDRNLSTNTSYRWRVRTVDSASRTGSYRTSAATRITRYQNTSTAITYAGTWGTSTAGSPSGGSQRFTTAALATASITVTNKERFAIVGAKSSSRGSFRVYVDNVLVAAVSAKTSSSTVNYRRVLYHGALTSGVGVSHTIRVEAVGNGRVDLDAILTLGAP